MIKTIIWLLLILLMVFAYEKVTKEVSFCETIKQKVVTADKYGVPKFTVITASGDYSITGKEYADSSNTYCRMIAVQQKGSIWIEVLKYSFFLFAIVSFIFLVGIVFDF
jgi:hypothetical protein